VRKEKTRVFRQLGFIDPGTLSTAARKKEVVSLIEGIPMSHIKPDTAFFVSDDERHTAAILFDDTQADAFLDALEEMDHISRVYIVTRSNQLFQNLKAQITDLLGPIEVQEEEKRPMREGFPANLEYFKLDFLEKNQVALGRQFRAILPLLWLRAGAVGPRPELAGDDSIPPMLLPVQNPFAVLIDETRFADFQAALAARDDLTHVFLITDSGEAFQEMATQVTAPHVIQLYRDYLENFAINGGGAS
jgi:adenine-specific DNA-methyltransferase